MRIIRLLPVVVFLALALVPAVLFTVTGPWPGATQPRFRPLRELPERFRFSASSFRAIDAWFTDRIGLRWPLLSLGVQMTDRVWQPRTRLSVIVGRGPWLFWTDDESQPTSVMGDARGRLRLPETSVATIDATLRAVRSAYAACGKHAYFVLAPNKQSIYPEELGENRDRPTRFDGLLEKLSPQARAMVIDPRPALRAAKSAQPFPLYFHGDTHWNTLGGYYAYRAVVEAMARDNAIYAPGRAALENYTISVKPFEGGGDIVMRILYLPGRSPDILPEPKPKPPLRDAAVTEVDGTLTFTNPDGRGRLVMRGDSFGPQLAASLARHFAEVVMLRRTSAWLAFDGEQARNADVELLESAERFLPTFATPPVNPEKACGK